MYCYQYECFVNITSHYEHFLVLQSKKNEEIYLVWYYSFYTLSTPNSSFIMHMFYLQVSAQQNIWSVFYVYIILSYTLSIGVSHGSARLDTLSLHEQNN